MRVGLPLLLLGAQGCAAAKVGLQIVAAEARLLQAESQDADVKSVYEYTLASQYLLKAREEAAGSEFRIADALARASAEWSDKAVITAQRQRTVEIDTVPVDVVVPVEEPPPAIPTPDDGIEDFDTPEVDDDIDIDGRE
jgi:hypothetical protein